MLRTGLLADGYLLQHQLPFKNVVCERNTDIVVPVRARWNRMQSVTVMKASPTALNALIAMVTACKQ